MLLSLSSILVLSVFVVPVTCQQAALGQNAGDPIDQNDVGTVTIALTCLDVGELITDANGQIADVNAPIPDANVPAVKLSWKIKNDLEQDIWICSGVGWVESDEFSHLDYEAFLNEDNTLVIRQRLDVPAMVVYYIWPQGRYVRLRAGQERSESLSLSLPVRHNWLFVPRLEKSGVVHARRMVIEIGYHTKDLARMICEFEESPEDPNGYDEAIIPYLSSLNQGESILRITVDGVCIPYEDTWVGYNAVEGEVEGPAATSVAATE
jgi:hypothetical protein